MAKGGEIAAFVMDELQKKDKKTKWKKPQSFGDVPDYDKRLPVDLDDVVDSDSFSADGW